MLNDSIAQLPTPCLVVDRKKLGHNIERMSARARSLGVTLRPHMKTTKSVDVARLVFEGGIGPITVSTLKEAEYFSGHGFTDIHYAVGISPDKLERAFALSRAGVNLILTLDDPEVATAVVSAAAIHGAGALRVAIEIDTDGHRAGLVPDDERVVSIARTLTRNNIRFHGLMTHAGESYNVHDRTGLEAHAELERSAMATCASRLRAEGFRDIVVSVGSTPTLTAARHLDGVDEVRAGVYMFQDLFQSNLSVCSLPDLALTVLTTVIGRRPDLGFLIVDAGGLAMSKDRGTASQHTDYGYGLVCDASGAPLPQRLIVGNVMQEHGLISLPAADFGRFPLGTKLRILPNHACMTAAAHDHYHVIDTESGSMAVWPRCNGW
jgi:D-serine deaminase-like pyridoxal phosphate-dependent protein